LHIIIGDVPVVVQFAASNGKDLADAAEMVAKYVKYHVYYYYYYIIVFSFIFQ